MLALLEDARRPALPLEPTGALSYACCLSFACAPRVLPLFGAHRGVYLSSVPLFCAALSRPSCRRQGTVSLACRLRGLTLRAQGTHSLACSLSWVLPLLGVHRDDVTTVPDEDLVEKLPLRQARQIIADQLALEV